jgi:hypothetical protein
MPFQADDEAIISRLLVTWEKSHEDGRDVTPEDLCGDRTDLVDELRRCIGVLRAFDLWLPT